MAKPRFSLIKNPKAGTFGSKESQAQFAKRINNTLGKYNNLTIQQLNSAEDKDLGGILIAMGGDGTVNAVAGSAIKWKRKLAVIPAGTFNHFAKDMGLPLDFADALQKIKTGKTSKIDYGAVNDKLFLNNSVIGFYPKLLADKKGLAKYGKWPALVISSFKILFRLKKYRLKLIVDGKELNLKTTLVVIANNKYQLSSLGLAERQKMDQGKLWVYVVKPKNISGVALASLRLLAGKVKPKDFKLYSAETLEIHSKKSKLRVAVDGEHYKLATPLIYKINKKSLKVIS